MTKRIFNIDDMRCAFDSGMNFEVDRINSPNFKKWIKDFEGVKFIKDDEKTFTIEDMEKAFKMGIIHENNILTDNLENDVDFDQWIVNF